MLTNHAHGRPTCTWAQPLLYIYLRDPHLVQHTSESAHCQTRIMSGQTPDFDLSKVSLDVSVLPISPGNPANIHCSTSPSLHRDPESDWHQELWLTRYIGTRRNREVCEPS